MGDAAKRFLHATHLYWQFLDEANRMPELPPPWVCPLQCWWPRSAREPKMESAAYWPDDEGDRHRAKGPSIDDLERLAEEACREAGVWEHSSPDVRKKIRTLLEKTIALPLDYDMKANPAAVDIWFEEYRELKPYCDEPYRDEPMLTAPATVTELARKVGIDLAKKRGKGSGGRKQNDEHLARDLFDGWRAYEPEDGRKTKAGYFAQRSDVQTLKTLEARERKSASLRALLDSALHLHNEKTKQKQKQRARRN